MNKAKASLGHRRTLQERLLKKLWLIVPLGVIGVVVALFLSHPRKSLVERFTVTTPGLSIPAQPTGVALPGTHIPELKREHIPDSQRVNYNSNPPTSGPHYAVPAQWGIYNDPPVDERLVHNLEHGGVIINYNPERIQDQELDQLRVQTRELSAINPRIIMTPRPNLDSAVVLTAWGYLQKLDSYNPKAVKTFYNAHIARGPECQSGHCPG